MGLSIAPFLLKEPLQKDLVTQCFHEALECGSEYSPGPAEAGNPKERQVQDLPGTQAPFDRDLMVLNSGYFGYIGGLWGLGRASRFKVFFAESKSRAHCRFCRLCCHVLATVAVKFVGKRSHKYRFLGLELLIGSGQVVVD